MKYIIIAPHPDDELIGCFMLFKRKLVKKVIYIEPDIVRKNEAIYFCEAMRVQCVFIEKAEELNKIFVEKDHIYMAPSLQDHHPLHKMISVLGKRFRFGLYSIDMNAEFVKELHPRLRDEKREILNKYYSSQKSLWENDHKYFLFEGTVREV